MGNQRLADAELPVGRINIDFRYHYERVDFYRP
jgi:hypothetical protein